MGGERRLSPPTWPGRLSPPTWPGHLSPPTWPGYEARGRSGRYGHLVHYKKDQERIKNGG